MALLRAIVRMLSARAREPKFQMFTGRAAGPLVVSGSDLAASVHG
jgi:hypothetical protein